MTTITTLKPEKVKLEWNVDKLSLYEPSEVASMPNLPFNLEPNENQTIAKFTLIHTLPSINAKGRGVTYRTQRNSISSIKFNPVSYEHLMVSNGNYSNEDIILGVMLGATIEELPNNPIIPDTPVPAEVWAVLWNRVEHARRIIEDVETGYRSWKASYEISTRSEDALYHKGIFYPISEAPEHLIQKIGPESTGSVDGDQVVLALGGKDGYINFFGAGLTLTPADYLNPEIELETASVKSKKMICLAIPSQDKVTTETASETTNPKKHHGGGTMTNEEKEKMEKELKEQLASLSPALQSVINSSGLDASKAKQLVDTIKAENESKVSEIASEIEKKYKDDYVLKSDLEKAEQASYDKAVEVEIPKAKEAWEKELASIAKREQAIESANIPLTEPRKEKLKSFAFDEDGDKAFEDYLNELKEVASLKTKTKKETVGSSQKETASIGSLLNTNSTETPPETDEKKTALSALFK